MLYQDFEYVITDISFLNLLREHPSKLGMPWNGHTEI